MSPTSSSTVSLATSCQVLAEQIQKIFNYSLTTQDELLLDNLKSIWIQSESEDQIDSLLTEGLSIDNLALLVGVITSVQDS